MWFMADLPQAGGGGGSLAHDSLGQERVKKKLSVEKPIVKGYNFYKSGKVFGLYSKSENGLFFIKSQVLPSHSKAGPAYTVKIMIGSILLDSESILPLSNWE